jgi:hypothetical protein
MAEQSRLARLGLRSGIVGAAASLAIAAPLVSGNYNPTCHTDAARIGWYFDRTPANELVGLVIGGVAGQTVYTSPGTPTAQMTLAFITPNPSVIIGDGTGTPVFTLSGASGGSSGTQFNTGTITHRFTVVRNSTAESGGDLGSQFAIGMWDDSGVFTDQIVLSRKAFSVWSWARPCAVNVGTITTAIIAVNVTTTWNEGSTAFIGYRLNVTDTLSDSASLLLSMSVGAQSIISCRKDGLLILNCVDDLVNTQIAFNRSFTLTGGLTDVQHYNSTNALNGAFTLTRYNWFDLNNPTGAATVTTACVLQFDANAGTHCAIDAATTKATVATVNAWIKHNINGTIYYSQCYTSKTT